MFCCFGFSLAAAATVENHGKAAGKSRAKQQQQKTKSCLHPAKAKGVAEGARKVKIRKRIKQTFIDLCATENLKLKLEQHEKRARHACWKNSDQKLPTTQKGGYMYDCLYTNIYNCVSPVDSILSEAH